MAALICKIPKRQIISDADYLSKEINISSITNYVSLQRSLICLFIFLSGQRLDHAAETYPNRDAYVFPQTNQRLTFEALKIQVTALAVLFPNNMKIF